MKPWWVYIVRCRDGSLYTGISDDVGARIAVHNRGKGARYTQGRGPVKLVYSECHENKSDALKRELQIKKFNKVKKERLVVK